MTGKLRLGPLPRAELVRMTVNLPMSVKADLDRYAEVYRRTYGQTAIAADLIPDMIAAFMERDRAFRKARQAASSRESTSEPIIAASARTNDAGDEGSSPR
jgi:hypothetical protein